MAFTPKQIEQWQQMADLTMAKCRQKCHKIGMCCSPEYCEMAAEYAKEHGIALEPVGSPLLFLNNERQCIVPPHLRPLCTLHQCDINGFGFCPDDPEWTEKYFDLRTILEEGME